MHIVDITTELPTHPHRRYAQRSPSAITAIVTHHSATPPASQDGRRDAEAFARYHMGTHEWPGIGYHYVIGPDGTVMKTNHNTSISYHASGANRYSLGVCLVGDFTKSPPPPAQWQAAVELVKRLCAVYHIPADRVLGHREIPEAGTSCPGIRFDLSKFRREVGA